MNEIILNIENLSVEFDGLTALNKFSLVLGKGETVGLIGPNGAGKSTVLKAAVGLVPLKSGLVYLAGQKIKPSPAKMVGRGVVYFSQDQRVFANLRVRDNLVAVEGLLTDRRLFKERSERVLKLFPVLQEKMLLRAGELSGGEQQMVALARGLLLDPQVLLLDEPTLGLSPKLTKELSGQLKEIRRQLGVAMVVVEHNLKFLTGLVDRVLVLDGGELVREIDAAELESEKAIMQLGRELI